MHFSQLLGPVRLKLGMMPCKDRDLFWEGIDGLKAQELIDVCRRRAIRFHGVRALDLRSKHSGLCSLLSLCVRAHAV